jgi:hypothetical protein
MMKCAVCALFKLLNMQRRKAFMRGSYLRRGYSYGIFYCYLARLIGRA